MQIFLIESYYDGSHKNWADGLIANSTHNFTLFDLPGRFWKWRMQGSAITIAERINQHRIKPDIILCSSLIDLACLKALVRHKNAVYIMYMHENQLTYPMSKYSKDNYQELSLGYLNYKSCLSSDYVIFNSYYHLEEFLKASKKLLGIMPDFNNLYSVELIRIKSSVIPIGMNIDIIHEYLSENEKYHNDSPTLIWNHRWEQDKNPELYLKLISDLDASGLDFQLNFTNVKNGEVIKKIINDFGNRISHIVDCKSYPEYLHILHNSDIIPVTSNHDFFGLSVLEAIYMKCLPILPDSLCYQEHFINSQVEYFYNTYNELLDKTISAILNWKSQSLSLKNRRIKNYNWKNIIIQYDNFFDKLI